MQESLVSIHRGYIHRTRITIMRRVYSVKSTRTCNMEELRYGFLIFCLISSMYGGLADVHTDCSKQNSTTSNDAVTPTTQSTPYPFRADLLTVEECNLYQQFQEENSTCSMIFSFDTCVVDNEHPRKEQMGATYVQILCIYQPRALIANTTKHVREISPLRAVLLNLYEWKDEEDPVTFDVVEPVQNQIIDLCILDCRYPNTTAKVYELGTFPYLYSFALNGCANMTIQKKHFSRMPQLRMIAFYMSTIETLEPGTFTDLPLLRSLILERFFGMVLATENDPSQAAMYSHIGTEDYLDRLYTLHCDCSFAWLRNFLKRKPYLIEAKVPGEVFIVGNYLSEGVERTGNGTDVFSVDCSRKITLENVWTGSEFSYNTTDCDVAC
ncbi:uncharacterized protein LOC129595707 [Paramacrobiotus metropolitanus]|uniref:uncharacterized protein LOC129595707 n=1 Tax=Paramacrobiotus metropolitanus TaxID=2943436 RepID=UPI0024460DF5|nr:uncharacterized protein LOC129595707 [Paramacrobiotus metropolitanus]